MLAKILANIQKPGALKLTLAVAAITWGATTVMKVTNEATEAAQAAEDHYVRRMAELEALDKAIGAAENRMTAIRREAEAAREMHTPESTGENID